MRSDLKNGKVQITLHESDKRTLSKARDMLTFIERNSTEGELQCSAATAHEAIGGVLAALCAETPDQNEGEPVSKRRETVAA